MTGLFNLALITPRRVPFIGTLNVEMNDVNFHKIIFASQLKPGGTVNTFKSTR